MLVIMSLLKSERAHLLEERAQLYYRAISTLLDTWNQWRSTGSTSRVQSTIPFDRVVQVWAAVASWMRRTRPTGVVHRAQLIRQLERVLAEKEYAEVGDDAQQGAETYLRRGSRGGLLELRATKMFAFWHSTSRNFFLQLNSRHRAVAPSTVYSHYEAIQGGVRLFCSLLDMSD